MAIRQIGYDPDTGQLDLEQVRARSLIRRGRLFREPILLGFLELHGDALPACHDHGPYASWGNPISLGILTPPPTMRRHRVGDIQPAWHAHAVRGGQAGHRHAR